MAWAALEIPKEIQATELPLKKCGKGVFPAIFNVPSISPSLSDSHLQLYIIHKVTCYQGPEAIVPSKESLISLSFLCLGYI